MKADGTLFRENLCYIISYQAPMDIVKNDYKKNK